MTLDAVEFLKAKGLSKFDEITVIKGQEPIIYLKDLLKEYGDLITEIESRKWKMLNKANSKMASRIVDYEATLLEITHWGEYNGDFKKHAQNALNRNK